MASFAVGVENSTPIELHDTDQGSEAPVRIHGWPLSGRSWKSQVGVLVEAGSRVTIYDRRGFGQSSQPWEGYDDESAYGTERVSRAVLAAAVPPDLDKSEDPEGGLDDATITGFGTGVTSDRAACLEEFTTGFFSSGRKLEVSEPTRPYAVSLAAVASPRATRDCIAAFGRTDLRADVAAVTVPTLVIHGDSDGIVPLEVSGQRSADSIAGAQLVVVKGGPHGLNVSHAEEFNAALLAFLAP